MDWSPKETAQQFEDWCIDTNCAPGDKAFVPSLTLALCNFLRHQLKIAGIPDEIARVASDNESSRLLAGVLGLSTHQVRTEHGLPTLN